MNIRLNEQENEIDWLSQHVILLSISMFIETLQMIRCTVKQTFFLFCNKEKLFLLHFVFSSLQVLRFLFHFWQWVQKRSDIQFLSCI